MNELQVTVVGWAATDVRLTVGRNGASVASFRLASTPRYFDRSSGSWVDGTTEWFSVRVFRGAAILLERSIKKGHPVLVTGRMHSNQWESEKGPRTDLVIDAVAVGHDLTRGFASFSRAVGDELMGEGGEAPAPDAAGEHDGVDDAAFESETVDVSDPADVDETDAEDAEELEAAAVR